MENRQNESGEEGNIRRQARERIREARALRVRTSERIEERRVEARESKERKGSH